MALPGAARPMTACPRSPSLSPAPSGMARVSLASGIKRIVRRPARLVSANQGLGMRVVATMSLVVTRACREASFLCRADHPSDDRLGFSSWQTGVRADQPEGSGLCDAVVFANRRPSSWFRRPHRARKPFKAAQGLALSQPRTECRSGGAVDWRGAYHPGRAPEHLSAIARFLDSACVRIGPHQFCCRSRILIPQRSKIVAWAALLSTAGANEVWNLCWFCRDVCIPVAM